MEIVHRIFTNTYSDGRIEQVVELIADGVSRQLSRTVANTQELQTRQALIAIGWTPPKSEAGTSTGHDGKAWPPEDRIDVIGQNGPSGDHYIERDAGPSIFGGRRTDRSRQA